MLFSSIKLFVNVKIKFKLYSHSRTRSLRANNEAYCVAANPFSELNPVKIAYDCQMVINVQKFTLKISPLFKRVSTLQ